MKVIIFFPRLISEDMNEELEVEIKKKELKFVLNSSQRSKSPSPDG